MKKYLTITFLFLLLAPTDYLVAQSDTLKLDGVKVIIPSNEKKKSNTYIFFAAGYQLPSWYRVPMIPEFHHNITVKGNMNIKSPGWFAGMGIMKKTKSHFEFGILANYYKTSIPIAWSGQRSTSDWVYLQSDSLSFFTDVFDHDINRISEVFSFRATFRYKIPVGKFQFWGGVSPGTYSSKISFSDNPVNEGLGIYRETSLGLNFEAGIDILIKDKKGKDVMLFTLFSDFSGPRIEERMSNLIHAGWKFNNTEGNYAINPARLGIAIGIF